MGDWTVLWELATRAKHPVNTGGIKEALEWPFG